MAELFANIKAVLFDFNGILVKKDDYLVDNELRKMKNDFLSDLTMEHASSDRNNLHHDVENVTSDLRRAIKKYKLSKEKA